MFQILLIQQQELFELKWKLKTITLNYKDGLTAEIFIPVKEINGHLIPPSSLTLNEEGQVGVRHIVNKNIAKFSKVEILGDEDEVCMDSWFT